MTSDLQAAGGHYGQAVGNTQALLAGRITAEGLRKNQQNQAK
jgi:hypothetical protein